MRNAAVAMFLSTVATILVLGVRPVQAFESFTLGERDKIVAEAPGCHAECRIMGAVQRVCTLKNMSCRAMCQTLPECSAPGQLPLKVCAIVRTDR